MKLKDIQKLKKKNNNNKFQRFAFHEKTIIKIPKRCDRS